MSKKSSGRAGALLGGLLLLTAAVAIACTSGGDEPGRPPEPAVTTADTAELDIAYVETIRDGAPEWAAYSDATLVDIATGVCAAFDNGASLPDVTVELVDSYAVGASPAAYLAGVAVAAYCPEHEDIVRGAK